MKRHTVFLLSTVLGLLLYGLTASSQDAGLSLRMMTYNIQHGAGMDDVIDLDRQAAVIRDAMPDVVGLQEVDSCVKRSGYKPQAALLGSKTGMYATFGGAIPLTGGKYGVAILSKEKPLSHRNIPLPGNEKRTLLVCEFQEYVFACTHLALEEENRLASLPIILEEVARWEKPFFICGDWNDIPSSTLISRMKTKGFRMLSYVSNTSTYYTYPAGTPKKLIDYIASYGKVYNSIVSRKVLNEPEASDHRPVLVEVNFDGYTVGIQSPSSDGEATQNGDVYDLTGRRVEDPSRRGLFIQNGRKFVVR